VSILVLGAFVTAGAAGALFTATGGPLRDSTAADGNEADIRRAPAAAAPSRPQPGKIDFFNIGARGPSTSTHEAVAKSLNPKEVLKVLGKRV
jgi:hypothetical protein